MATKTKADLVKRALQKLQIVSATEEPSAADAVLAGDMYDTLRLELVTQGIGALMPNAVPQAMFEAMAEYLARRCAEDFGMGADEASEMRARKRLYAVAGTPYSGDPVEAKYF